MTREPKIGEWVRITKVREGEVTDLRIEDSEHTIAARIRAENGRSRWAVLDEDAVVEQISKPVKFDENDVAISPRGTPHIRHHDRIWRSGRFAGGAYTDGEMADLLRRSRQPWRLLRRGEFVE